MLIILALAATIFGTWAFALLVAILALLMMLEWQSMTSVARTSPPAVLQSAVVIIVAAFVVAGYPTVAIAVLGLGAIGAAIAARVEGLPVSYSIAGVLVVGIPAFAVIWLRGQSPDGLEIVLWLFAVVWASDSGAYAVGRLIGGPAFAPDLSPNKTWAGVIGGYIAALAVGTITAAVFFGLGGIWFWVLTNGLAAFAAQAGDISESAFKRHVGVKDSGTLIPGHGGVFDRLDGFLMASSLVAIWYFGATLWLLP